MISVEANKVKSHNLSRWPLFYFDCANGFRLWCHDDGSASSPNDSFIVAHSVSLLISGGPSNHRRHSALAPPNANQPHHHPPPTTQHTEHHHPPQVLSAAKCMTQMAK